MTEQNINILNLLVFLFGGIGVMVIQMTYEKLKDGYKTRKEKANVLRALDIERQGAIELCNTIILSLEGHLSAVCYFTTFHRTWFSKYIETFLDFSNPNDLRIYSFVKGSLTLMSIIEQLNSNSNSLSISSRALTTFPVLLERINVSTLDRARELLAVLTSFSIYNEQIILPPVPK